MRINIDLPEQVAKQYKVLAAQKGTDRKNFIQDLLIARVSKVSKLNEVKEINKQP